MDRVAGEQLPETMGYEWTELALQEILAGKDLLSKLVFPLAVLFVFMVLAAQYESWSLPFAILLIVPMCLLSSIGGVYFIKLNNDIFVQIGFVVLIGLAAKNAILVVEFSKQLQGEGKGPDCPFCEVPSLGDEEGLIVARGTDCFAVLNLYPYNSGHLMVVPYRHISGYEELTAGEANEIAALTQHAIRAVRHASGAHGFNIGMNLGTIAGAGIAAHLHQHVVPRWGGDSNFLPIIARTKALPMLLEDVRSRLVEHWPA
jgi:ATP adenylyltransferase